MQNASLIFIIVAFTINSNAQMQNNSNSLSSAENLFSTIFPDISANAFNINTGNSSNKNIAYVDASALIVRHNGELHYLVTTYDFDPLKLPINLQQQLNGIKAVILKESLQSKPTTSTLTHALPPWLSSFYGLQGLYLENATLENPEVLTKLNLKALIFKGPRTSDQRELVHSVSQLKSLKYLVNGSFFSPSELDKIKKCLPDLIITSTDQ
jgi:hypothetical protein